MKITELNLTGVYEVAPELKEDERGYFARLYCSDIFSRHGLNTKWQQSNVSLSRKKGTVRGLHFQYPPSSEVKYVRCTNGVIYDVVVDVRRNSTTFGCFAAVTLNSEKQNAVYVPKGFAHGFQALSENVEIMYMVSDQYNPETECTLNPLDETLNIEWPISISSISKKDLNGAKLSEIRPVDCT